MKIILCLTLVVCNLTACKKEVRTIEPSGEISEKMNNTNGLLFYSL